MSRATILLVVGSRPEAIKLAPVVFALREQADRFDAVICSTGQQRDLIPQALGEFNLEPDIELDVMREDQTLAGLTARLVTSLDSVLGQITPDWVLVQGDTTSAMVGALAGFYRGVPVGHVEAGLRTDDRRAPFPEEVNRRIISQCADLHFAPTERSAARLLSEGLPAASVQMTGNTVVDALLWMRDRIRQGESSLPASLVARLGTKRLVLVTTHRRESFGAGIEHTCAAILSLAQSMDDVVFALPVHPNPRVRDVVLERLDRHPRIALLEPQPYRALVELMDRATLILTDSGGVQEEAPTFGTPVLVLRTTTERPEGIEAGVAKLVGTDRDRIVEEALELLRNPEARARMSAAVSPYGDGLAAQRIVHALRDGRRFSAAGPVANVAKVAKVPNVANVENKVNGQAAQAANIARPADSDVGMKILIAAKRLAADRTSEGICSSKYVGALVAAGHDVRCLTTEDAIDDQQKAWHARCAPVQIIDRRARLSAISALSRLNLKLASTGSIGAYSSRKANGFTARATGYSLTTWDAVERWRRAIRSAVRAERPDVLVIRGAGREFEPHMAMVGWKSPVPWMAHYHDPYPGSLYPAPYRQHVALQSPMQEHMHRRIVKSAQALTFPSQRLLEWVLCGELEKERRKAFVVPHLAGAPIPGGGDDARSPTELDPNHLNIVHTGTLLRERDPRALLRGFLTFAESDPLRRQYARLVLVGRVDGSHTASEEWRRLTRLGLLRCVEHRISYRSALAASRVADCLVILEANAAESPFFPAKLADYLWLGKPIIAVSPKASATADILGRDNPLLIEPADHVSAAAAFERIWNAWRTGNLAQLAPAPAVASSMSEAAVGNKTNEIFEFLLKTQRTKRKRAA